MLWIPYFAMSKRKRLLDQVNKQSQRALETNYINVKWEMPLKRTYFSKWHSSYIKNKVDFVELYWSKCSLITDQVRKVIGMGHAHEITNYVL